MGGVRWILFFFSSRRRHTRSLCDWSSDVCSSDLIGFDLGWKDVPLRDQIEADLGLPVILEHDVTAAALAEHAARSEERRVGKSVDLGGRWIFKQKRWPLL